MNDQITLTVNDPELQRLCPQCGGLIVYTTKYAREGGELAKANCHSCRSKATKGVPQKRALPPKRAGYSRWKGWAGISLGKFGGTYEPTRPKL